MFGITISIYIIIYKGTKYLIYCTTFAYVCQLFKEKLFFSLKLHVFQLCGAIFTQYLYHIFIPLQHLYKKRLSTFKEETHLTPIEYKILRYLIENRGRVLTHKMIQEKVWGYTSTDDYQSLRVFMENI